MKETSLFSLKGKGIIVTGGAGFLGRYFIRVIAENGGFPVIWDADSEAGNRVSEDLTKKNLRCKFQHVDITDLSSIQRACEELGAINFPWWGLVNNACINPKMEDPRSENWQQGEFDLTSWNNELSVGLTGAWNCVRIVGPKILNAGGGSIVNIASDLGIIAPDQRIYFTDEEGSRDEAPKKPVSYSIIKHGIIGFTKYLATDWGDQGIRTNSISPAGIENNQDAAFVKKLANCIPMARMCQLADLQGPLIFLLSESSSFVNGHNLVVDGGRTIW